MLPLGNDRSAIICGQYQGKAEHSDSSSVWIDRDVRPSSLEVEIPFFRHCLPPLLEALSQLRHPGLHMAVASSAPRYAALHKNEHVTGSTCSPLHKSRDKKKIANHQPLSHLPNGRRS
jgi:hypothetical protein